MIRLIQRITYHFSYVYKPRWDTGIPAPELVHFINGKTPGNAIDMGCGTGTNLLFLVQHKWRITGVDFAPLAITKAKRKLGNYPQTLLVADVTKLSKMELPGPYDLALDMGCFHSLSRIDRSRYLSGLEKWIKPEGVLLLYAFQPSGSSDTKGVAREEVCELFRDSFDLFQYEQGQGRPSAWYYFKRKLPG